MSSSLHLLHVFPTFGAGGSQARFALLTDRLGSDFRHTVLSSDGQFLAPELLRHTGERLSGPSNRASYAAPFFYARLLRRLRPDILLTYNWGSIDAILGALISGYTPVIHTEDGFNPDEAVNLKKRRVLTRRFALNRIYRTVLPSTTLEKIALEQYRVASERIQLIPNGVDVARFAPRGSAPMRSQLGIAPDEFVVGTVGRLNKVKNLPLLVRAFAAAKIDKGRLVIVGGGAEETAIRETAAAERVADKVMMTGPASDTAPYYSAFDLFAMSSDTEQMPVALLEAMASGLPALCTDVGDSAAILAAREAPEITPRGDLDRYVACLRGFASDPQLRRRIADKNQRRCREVYPLDRMVETYRELYVACASGKRPR